MKKSLFGECLWVNSQVAMNVYPVLISFLLAFFFLFICLRIVSFLWYKSELPQFSATELPI